MNEVKHAEELRETGEYNAHSALLRVNKGRKKENKLTKKQFLEKLRRAYFLNTGATGKPHDPKQNKPFKTWVDQGLARTERFTYQQKNSDKEGEYKVVVFTEKGMEYIERIINDSNYSMLPLKLKLEKQQEQPKPSEWEIEKKRKDSEASRNEHMQQIQEALG